MDFSARKAANDQGPCALRTSVAEVRAKLRERGLVTRDGQLGPFIDTYRRLMLAPGNYLLIILEHTARLLRFGARSLPWFLERLTMRAKAILLGVALMCAAFAGCSLLHHGPTPEQQYVNALAHGYGAEASQRWLAMTPDQRISFQHGAGFEAAARAQTVKSAIAKRFAQDAQEGADISVSLPQTPTGGSLQDLGSYSDSPQ
jgi:hypothetical protein